MKRTAGALLGGLSLACASEPVGLSILLVVGMTLWFLVLAQLGPERRARRAALLGLVFGVSFFFPLLFWMRAVGPDAWLALSAVEAAFLVPLAVLTQALQRRTRWWPLAGPVAWVAVETVRGSWPFSGMPWGRLSYSVADSLWAPGLPWWGFTGVSFLIACTGAVLAWLGLRIVRPAGVPGHAGSRSGTLVPALTAGAVLVGLALPALVSLPSTPSGTLRVAVVQGDVPGAGDDLLAVHEQVTEAHVRLTHDLAEEIDSGAREPVDLVLWPENSTAVDPFLTDWAREAVQGAVDDIGVPVLVGAMVSPPDPTQVLNQGIVWWPGTGGGDRYTKRHPVPFGEYIPWRDLFSTTFGRLEVVGRDMASGTRTTPLDVGGVKVADAICFDVAYDDTLDAQVANGAEFAVVQTSNAMFIHTHQIAQQYEITRLRAQTIGRPLAVAAVNGVSGVVGPDGEVLVEAEPRTESVLVREVETRTGLTPAVRVGSWPARAAVVLTALMAVLLLPFRGRVRPAARRSSQATGAPVSGTRPTTPVG